MIKIKEILKQNNDKNTLNTVKRSTIVIGQTTAVTLAIETALLYTIFV